MVSLLLEGGADTGIARGWERGGTDRGGEDERGEGEGFVNVFNSATYKIY